MKTGRIAAFFDLDRTLIDVNSGKLWLRQEWVEGRLNGFEVARYVWWLLAYHWGVVDFERALQKTLAHVKGRSAAEMTQEFEDWARTMLLPRVCVEARVALDHHRAAGHVLVLLTTGSEFSAGPVARAVGIEHLLCTRLGVADGRLTGTIETPACYAAGKIVHAERFAACHRVELSRSYFYTDSISDRPMLERVGEPRVVNPDFRLRRLARKRGWSCARWRSAAGV